ncbi:hypothetical protein AK812_SmicGene47335, partial [Symbiodinium microadriaticum]
MGFADVELWVFALCGPFDLDNMDKMDSCPGLEKWINSTHMDHHHHWHSKWMSVTLSSTMCPSCNEDWK